MGNPEKLTRAHNTQETKTFHFVEYAKITNYYSKTKHT